MPAFGELFSEAELDDLVGFIYSLQEYPSDEPLPEPMALSAVSTVGSSTLEEGRALYLLVGCWRCHGLRGGGDGPSAKTLTDENERPVRSTNFRRAAYKGGREPLDVVRALRTGLNGMPMPSYDEALMLSSSDVGDKPLLEGYVPADEFQLLDRFLGGSPTPAALGAMSQADLDALRDRRLDALAHYVLSLSRRKGAGSWLFHKQPELEPREP